MSTETVELLGKLTSLKVARDAIHIAVIPVQAHDMLLPGQHVHLNDAGKAIAATPDTSIGIVDPFLTDPVDGARDQVFWLYLKPGSIESLRHHWTHEAFEGTRDVTRTELAAARSFMAHFASEVQMSMKELLHAGIAFNETGETFTLNHDTPEVCYDRMEDFWKAFTIITGDKLKQHPRYESNKAPGFFSCSC